MDKIYKFEMWVGGKFVCHPYLRYEGGVSTEFENVDLDYMNEQYLHDMYLHCGGTKHIVNFYYVKPGDSIDLGVTLINGDLGIFGLQRTFQNLDIPVVIYVEDVDDLITIEEVECENEGGGILMLDSVEHEARLQSENEAVLQSENEAVLQSDSVENEARLQSENETVLQSENENEAMVQSENENEAMVQSENDDIDENQGSVQSENEARVQTENVVSDENEVRVGRAQTEKSKGKRHVEEYSEYDDSSDSDYVPHSASEVESSAPSLVLEDIEDSDDDDIFSRKNMSKKDLIEKFNKVLRKRRKVGVKKANIPCDQNASSQWYSDADEDDELDSLDGSNDEAPKHVYFRSGQNMKTFEFKVGMKFGNAKEFREVLRDYSVRNGYELELLKNENARITAVCKKGCDWRIHASVIMKGPTFQVKTIKGEHNCSKSCKNKLANSRYIAKRMESLIRDNPDVTVAKLKNTILRKCNVDISQWKVTRAKRAALDKIRGLDNVQYQRLWDYCETVRVRNPGSKLLLRKVEGSSPPVFEKMYFSLAAMKLGFLSGCRPVIGLDGCFLKTVYGGQLLAAVGRDGNDNLWPIAIALVPVENRENWTWFVSELMLDIGGADAGKWTFISDRQKGLIETLKELTPHCEHRFCVRHMYQNFKQKYKALELKEMFWKAASTGNRNDFEAEMTKIDGIDPDAGEWLRQIPPNHWSRSHFKIGCKSDILVNNLCESFNNYILDARDKPVISMFEWIRIRLMTRIQCKRTGMEKYNGTICPNILKKLNKNHRHCRNFLTTWCGMNEFEVDTGNNICVVNLEDKTCTCGLYQLNEYPCSHTLAAISDKRLNVEDFVDDCYKKDVYMQVYSHMIHAVPGQQDYIKTPFEPLAAPKLKSKKGRPKKMRRKGPDELQTTSTRKGLTHTCAKCLQRGHNKATCPNATHPQSKLFKDNSSNDSQVPVQNINEVNTPQPEFTQPTDPPPFTQSQSTDFRCSQTASTTSRQSSHVQKRRPKGHKHVGDRETYRSFRNDQLLRNIHAGNEGVSAGNQRNIEVGNEGVNVGNQRNMEDRNGRDTDAGN